MAAVEFIAKELSKQIDNNLFMEVTFNKLLEQAKEMEKQELIEMHDKGFDSVQQLNDDYAVSFALFLSTECETNGDKDGWWFYNKTWKTTNELLEIFKKEKYA
jgi:hypothetical protein